MHLSLRYVFSIICLLSVSTTSAIGGNWNISKDDEYRFDTFHEDPDSYFAKDKHLETSLLLRAPLPEANRVIRDYERYKSYRTGKLTNNFSFTGWIWTETSSKGELLDKARCHEKLRDFEVPTSPTSIEGDFIKCQLSYHLHAVKDFDGGIALFQKLFREMAYAEPDLWRYRQSKKKDFNPTTYQVGGVLAPFITYYTVNYDAFTFTDAERKVVDAFFARKALEEYFDKNDDGANQQCPIFDPMSLSPRAHKVNNCGTVRLRFAAAELALGMTLQNELLWKKGLWDLDFVLSMMNDEGFFVPTSAKGCKALGYLYSTSELFSINVEILARAGFDLLSYKTRHGKSLAEGYEKLFQQYEDVTISNHIAAKGIGSDSCGKRPFRTHAEFVKQEHPNGEWIPDKDRFMNWSMRYVVSYKQHWLDGKNLNNVAVDPFVGAYFTVQPFEIYNANLSGAQAAYWKAKLDKQASAMSAKQTALEAARKERIAANKARLKAQSEKLKAEEQERLAALEAARKKRIAANKSRLKAQAEKIKADAAQARLEGQHRLTDLKADLKAFSYQQTDTGFTLPASAFTFKRHQPARQFTFEAPEQNKGHINGEILFEGQKIISGTGADDNKLGDVQRFQILTAIISAEGTDYVAYHSRNFSDNGFTQASIVAADKCGQDHKPKDWLLIAVETKSQEVISRMQCQREIFAEIDPAYGLLHDIIWASSNDIHSYMMSPDI